MLQERRAPGLASSRFQLAREWLASTASTVARLQLRRIEELTGRDLARPVDASEVYVALECVRILGLA